MSSIQTRLAGGLLVSLIVLLLAQWLVVATSIHRLSEKYILSRLTHTSNMLVGSVSFQGSGQASFTAARVDPVYTQAFSGHYYKVSAGENVFRSRSLWDETLQSMNPAVGEKMVLKTSGPRRQKLLLLEKSYLKQGQKVTVTVAEDISVLESDIDKMLIAHGFASLVILVLLVTLQILIVRKSLAPLDRIRIDLQKLDSGIVEALEENVPREIFPLVREINVRIKAVQQRLQRSRRSTGNLAHALKGPLTLLTRLAQEDAIRNNQKLHDDLLDYTASIQHSIDREMKRARLAGAGTGGRQSRLEPELIALLQSLRAMYQNKALQINYDMPDSCATNMDREDLHEMLGNILDNACKWARQSVHIKIDCHDGLAVCVEDDGPGIAEELRESVLARGKRLDEQTGGYGLGLAIVEDVVSQYKGTLSLQCSERLGGLQVNIQLPGRLAAQSTTEQ